MKSEAVGVFHDHQQSDIAAIRDRLDLRQQRQKAG